jgi:hypothetical protein
MHSRSDPIEAAASLLQQRFPGAQAAVLAGSVVAGTPTSTSDLDVVVVIPDEDDVPWRESFTHAGWPVELFVHSERTLRDFFDRDVRQRRPSMIRMWLQGRLLADADGIGSTLKSDARRLFDAGYGGADDKELRKLRYLATDLLKDLEGEPLGPESAFVAPTLAVALCHLRLLDAGRWVGTGKWMFREANLLDPEWTAALVDALRMQATGDAVPLIQVAVTTLADVGGELFDGYTERWTGE